MPLVRICAGGGAVSDARPYRDPTFRQLFSERVVYDGKQFLWKLVMVR